MPWNEAALSLLVDVALRKLGESKQDEARQAELMDEYRALCRRYDTDPEYRAHIDRIIAELDAEPSLRARDATGQDIGADAITGDHREVCVQQSVDVVEFAGPERAEDVNRRVR